MKAHRHEIKPYSCGRVVDSAARVSFSEFGIFGDQAGFCDERVHIFLARGVTHGEASPEGSEEIELVRVPLAEIETLIAEVEDAKTLAGLLLYLRLR